jgi:hypothetical protein
MSRATYDLPSSRLSEVRQFLDSNPGDYRILNMQNYNESMAMGAYDLWGYDPGVPSRYAEFMAFTQGRNPDQADQYLRFKGSHKLYKMLRLKFILTSEYVVENPDAMPRLNLLSDCQVLPHRDQILAAMNDPAFDPARTVILERPPRIALGRSPAGTARIVDSSTDHLTIAADLDNPAILLVTDGWSRGWRAVPLSGSSQREYDVMPADYVLLAVPLEAGHHEFRLEYLPREYLIGKWISILSLIACLAWAGGMAWTHHLARRGRMHPLGPPQAAPGRSEAQGGVSRK